MEVCCIIHFLPLEKYPPAINLLRFIADKKPSSCKVYVLTNYPPDARKLMEIEGIQIVRITGSVATKSRWSRINDYFRFNYKAIRFLKEKKPDTLLYYESLSAGAPWFYKKYVNRDSRIFIHYHEYNTKEEIKQGMLLNRWLHWLEKGLYGKAKWVSHTNQSRMNFFLKDIGKKVPYTYMLPNYPPTSWGMQAKNISRLQGPGIGFVYVGALSMDTMYTREMAEFIAANADHCYWDIYSDNHDPAVLRFLKELAAPNIHFKGSVAYDGLPQVLPRYDVGVILYKGNTPNFAYNAPNKFFEYAATGLNIWYPPGMKEMNLYEQRKEKPWIRSIDFNQLRLPPLHDAYRVEQLPEQTYTAESIYQKIWSVMTEGPLITE